MGQGTRYGPDALQIGSDGAAHQVGLEPTKDRQIDGVLGLGVMGTTLVGATRGRIHFLGAIVIWWASETTGQSLADGGTQSARPRRAA